MAVRLSHPASQILRMEQRFRFRCAATLPRIFAIIAPIQPHQAALMTGYAAFACARARHYPHKSCVSINRPAPPRDHSRASSMGNCFTCNERWCQHCGISASEYKQRPSYTGANCYASPHGIHRWMKRKQSPSIHPMSTSLYQPVRPIERRKGPRSVTANSRRNWVV